MSNPCTERHQNFLDEVAQNFGDVIRATCEDPVDNVLLPSSLKAASGDIFHAAAAVAAVVACLVPTVFTQIVPEPAGLIPEADAASACYDALYGARDSGDAVAEASFRDRILRVVLRSPVLLNRLLAVRLTDFTRTEADALVTVRSTVAAPPTCVLPRCTSRGHLSLV